MSDQLVFTDHRTEEFTQGFAQLLVELESAGVTEASKITLRSFRGNLSWSVEVPSEVFRDVLDATEDVDCLPYGDKMLLTRDFGSFQLTTYVSWSGPGSAWGASLGR